MGGQIAVHAAGRTTGGFGSVRSCPQDLRRYRQSKRRGLMRTSLFFAATSFLFLLVWQGDAHLHALDVKEAVRSTDAPIKITINPEARVSVTRSGELPPPVACGSAIELPVAIVNQAFLTAPLEATL